MNILIATKNQKVIDVVESLGHHVIGTSDNRNDIENMIVSASEEPELLMVTNGLDGEGNLPVLLTSIKNKYENLRILFLAGPTDFENEQIAREYAALANAGVYDIYCESRMSKAILKDLIDNPRTARDVEYLNEYVRMHQSEYVQRNGDDLIDVDEYSPEANNIIVFSSAKGGSGKSFVSTNVAAAIAKYGRTKSDFKPPRVLLLEGDLQTLSLGTLLGISNPQYNIKTALRRIRTIVSDEGEVIASEDQQEIVNDFIADCCLQVTSDVPNLYAIVGSSFNLEEMEQVSPYHYFYLLGVVSELFDVVIIDANSALEHKTTGPVMQLARECFMIVASDWDSVRIASKFNKELANIGIAGKVKYVLNKYVTKAYSATTDETIEFNPEDYFSEKTIAAKIPYVDQIIQYNHIYQSKPIVFDDTFASLQARIAFTKLANIIWPMSNYKSLAAEVDALERELGGNKKKK